MWEMGIQEMQGRRQTVGYYIFYYAAMGIYLPFLPLFLADKGLDSFQIGILLAIGPLTTIFTQVAWGTMADRHNRRKEYLLLTLFLTGLISFTFSLPEGVLGFALVLFLYAVVNSAAIPLSDGIVLMSLEDRRDYGSIRRWGSFGFALTAVFGGIIFSYVSLSNFGLLEGTLLLTTLLWARYLPNPRGQVFAGTSSKSPLREMLQTPGVISFLVVTVFIMAPYTAYTGFFGWHMQALGASSGWIGLGWMVAALSEMIIFGTGSRWLARFQPKQLIMAAGVVFVARWFGYALIEDYRLIAFLQVFQSISFALFFLAGVEYLNSLLPIYLRTSGQSIFSATAFGFSALIGTLGGGWIIKVSDSGTLYLVLAGVVLLGVLLSRRLLIAETSLF